MLIIGGSAAVASIAIPWETWRFYRGPGPSPTAFASPSLDDSAWRQVSVPHDWSAEDLPDRADDRSTPVLAVRTGEWRFSPHAGNDSWASPMFDDSEWGTVHAPSDWRSFGYTARNATGWYRRHFTVTQEQLSNPSTRLALGTVASADITYVNGRRVGATGSFYHQHRCTDPLTYRSYSGQSLMQALQLGDNVVAVQVWSAGGADGGPRYFEHASGALPAGDDILAPAMMNASAAIALCNATAQCQGVTFQSDVAAPVVPVKVYFKSGGVPNGAAGWQSWILPSGHPGGLVDAQSPGDVRRGPFDAGASPGQKQTGYTVGGVGWYRHDFETPPVGSVAELYIEGCYMHCRIYLNGRELFEHPYGCAPPLPRRSFRHDATASSYCPTAPWPAGLPPFTGPNAALTPLVPLMACALVPSHARRHIVLGGAAARAPRTTTDQGELSRTHLTSGLTPGQRPRRESGQLRHQLPLVLGLGPLPSGAPAHPPGSPLAAKAPWWTARDDAQRPPPASKRWESGSRSHPRADAHRHA